MSNTAETKGVSGEAMVKIPLAAFRFVSRYPAENKIICEIDASEIERLNDAKTVDEIINEARLDYVSENYKTFTNVRDLLKELHS